MSAAVNPQRLAAIGDPNRCYLCCRTTRPESESQPDDARAPRPAYFCHHCGRLFCHKCEERYVRRPRWQRAFLRYAEVTALRPRGQRQLLEPWHCRFHRFERVRWRRLLPLLLLLSLIALLPVLLVGGGGGLALTLLLGSLPLLAFLAAVRQDGIAYANQHPYLPLLEPPTIRWIETVVADVEVGESYSEKVRSARGAIRTTVPLTQAETRGLAEMVSTHRLSDGEREALPAVVGALVFHNPGKTRDISWPTNSRRWEIEAPVGTIPFLRDGGGEPQHTFEMRYEFNWSMELARFVAKHLRGETTAPGPLIPMPLPVQLHANFARLGGRRTLSLRFEVLPMYRNDRVICKDVSLAWDAAQPAPELVRGSGRLTTSGLAVTTIEEVPIEKDGVAVVTVTFPDPLPQTTDLVVRGVATFSIFNRMLSELGDIAFYDALGRREDRVRPELRRTDVEMHFAIQLNKLTYSEVAHHKETEQLPASMRERLPHLSDFLEETTRVVSMRQGLLDRTQPDGAILREYHGHFSLPGEQDDPLTYNLILHEPNGGPEMSLRVTAISRGPGEATPRARRAHAHLREQIHRTILGEPPVSPPASPEPPDPVPPPSGESGSAPGSQRFSLRDRIQKGGGHERH